MSAGGQTYQILAGVRRAKAWQLSGAQTIRAQILDPDGKLIAERDVPVDSLLSPKSTIEMKNSRQVSRYQRIRNAIQAGQGSSLPPIEVTPGTRGTPIKNVIFEH